VYHSEERHTLRSLKNDSEVHVLAALLALCPAYYHPVSPRGVSLLAVMHVRYFEIGTLEKSDKSKQQYKMNTRCYSAEATPLGVPPASSALPVTY
jgi:hypothetical protein